MYTAPPGAGRDSYSTSRDAMKRIAVRSAAAAAAHAVRAPSLQGRRGRPSVQCAWYGRSSTSKPAAPSTMRHSSASAVSGAISRVGPSQSTRGALRGWERAEPVELDVERRCTERDRRNELERLRGPFLLDRSEEVHGQMERLRARPANIRNALPELALHPLRRPEPGVGERNGEEAPHPAGVAVGVALRLGLAGEGLGRAAAHGLPPALVSETSIWLVAQS